MKKRNFTNLVSLSQELYFLLTSQLSSECTLRLENGVIPVVVRLSSPHWRVKHSTVSSTGSCRWDPGVSLVVWPGLLHRGTPTIPIHLLLFPPSQTVILNLVSCLFVISSLLAFSSNLILTELITTWFGNQPGTDVVWISHFLTCILLYFKGFTYYVWTKF